MTIRNPVEWTYDVLRAGLPRGHYRSRAELTDTVPRPRRIGVSDLREALKKGFEDFGAYRTDVLFIGIIYPAIGLVLAQLVIGHELLPLIFPLFAGFALMGPAAASGLYEMSRRRENGEEVTWADCFAVVSRPTFGAILGLTAILAGVFLVWLGVAMGIYSLTLGSEPPVSIGAFVNDVLFTREGNTMIVFGCGVGFLFALFVLVTSTFSYPMLVDRNVTLLSAVGASFAAFRANPVVLSVWGLIVAAALAVGTLPVLLGLIVVMPVLGHATWHLYRRTFG